MIVMEHPKVSPEEFKAYIAPLTEAEQRGAAEYWATFVTEWDRLATEAALAGQMDVVDFLDEMTDTAADFWTHLSGY